jgi:hypothetical protein
MLNSGKSECAIFSGTINLDLVEKFKIVFLAHGALGYQDPNSYKKLRNFSEYDKLTVVPLVFSFLPAAAFQKSRSLEKPIKPLIEEHLETLSCPVNDTVLITILKAISDQYFASKIRGNIKKKGMSDLRSNRSLYKSIRSKQFGRCCMCGTRFDSNCRESLDHIIPYNLIGDVVDGSNWQILCEPCNRGKSYYISCLQAPEALNWVYASKNINTITEASRYVVLMNNTKCMYSSCHNTASNSRLSVSLKIKTGVCVPNHLEVLCGEHSVHS